MSMGGEVQVKIEDQAGKFIKLLNENIYATNKDVLYNDILQRGINKRSILLRSLSKRD